MESVCKQEVLYANGSNNGGHTIAGMVEIFGYEVKIVYLYTLAI